jgi:hypothetical protein
LLPADTDDLPEKQDPATAAPKLLHWIPLNLGPRRGTAVFALGGLRAIVRFYDDEGRGSICLGVLQFDPAHTLRRELLRQLLAPHPEIRLP